MKKMKIKRTFSLTLLFLLLVCSSAWAANFGFTDHAGQWLSGSDFSITIDWSDGLAVTAVEGNGGLRGVGDVQLALNTESPNFLSSYLLDAGNIKDKYSFSGPSIGVRDIPPLPDDRGIWSNSNGDVFIAWDLPSNTVMFYTGETDQLGNYTYLGMKFSDDFSFNILSDTAITLTSSDVGVVYGQRCICSGDVNLLINSTNAPAAVPIPGAIWLLSSGLFGLVCIRRKSKI
jgi:hypothetical protein